MGHRVLGLTVGDEVVRVAVVETRLRRFELRSAHEIERTREGTGAAPMDEGGAPAWATAGGGAQVGTLPATVAPAARATPVPTLLARAILPPPVATDTISTAFPGDRAFVRRLTFPFKETGRIRATLPFQMIGQVPIQPEDVHCGFERMATNPAGTEVLAVAVPRTDFAEFLAGCRAAGYDPSHVSVDGVCLLALAPYLPHNGANLIVWAEGSRADLAVADGLRPVLVRSVVLGEPVVAGGEASAAFLREVLITAASVSEGGVAVATVHVCGPAAETLAGPLGEAVGLPCKVLDPSRLPIPGAATCTGLTPSTAKAVALALAAAEGAGPGSLDLRTGAFGAEGSAGLLREHARFFAIVLALCAVLGVGRAVARYVGLNAEREAVKAEMRTFTAQLLGKERDDFDGVLKTMKSVSEDDIRIFPRWTAVDSLNRIVGAVLSMGFHQANAGGPGGAPGTTTAGGTAIPGAGAGGAGLPGGGAPGTGPNGGAPILPGTSVQPYAVEIESVRVDPKQGAVRGEADSIETLDGLVAKMKADPCFHDVVTESTERIQFERHQGWQRFSVRLNIDCVPPAKDTGKKPKQTAVAK